MLFLSMGRSVSENKVGSCLVHFFLKQITECDSQMVSKNLSLSICSTQEEIKAPPTLKDLRIDIKNVLQILWFWISSPWLHKRLLAKLIKVRIFWKDSINFHKMSSNSVLENSLQSRKLVQLKIWQWNRQIMNFKLSLIPSQSRWILTWQNSNYAPFNLRKKW